jgi:drug/metabolite transporter (DMT)-like permease
VLISNRHPTTRAACWMGGSLLSLVAMAVAARQLSSSMGVFQILFFRSLFGLAAICIILSRSGWRQLKTPQFGTHLVRNVSHFGGQYGWIYALAFIPMAQVFAIEFTAPVWTAILAALILGERFTLPRAASVVLGLVGVFIIVRPGSGMIHPAALAVLFGAMAFALSYTLTKKLSSTDSPLCVLFYMSALQLPFGLIPALSAWVAPPPASWPFIVLVGASGLSTHYCMTKAMKLADATIVVPMDFMRLPLIALVGVLLYGEYVQPTLFAGATLILAGTLLSLYCERKRVPSAKNG